MTRIPAGAADDAWIDWLEVAELYREQGLFQEAQDALGRYIDDHSSVTKDVNLRDVVLGFHKGCESDIFQFG